MLTLMENLDCPGIYQEARRRGIPDQVTEKMIKEFQREHWNRPGTLLDILEVVE